MDYGAPPVGLSMPIVSGGLGGLNARLAWAANALVVASAVVMLVALSLQVVARYVFGVALAWSEELSMALFTWTALLLLALGVRRMSHVRMVLLVERLPAALRRHHERAIHALTLLFGAYLAWSGWEYLDASSGMKSAALRFPMECLYLAAPVAGALIALFALESLLAGTVPGDDSLDELDTSGGSRDGV
jgi:TRAP-type C4-dicarboxylate transport system permease small subunit